MTQNGVWVKGSCDSLVTGTRLKSIVALCYNNAMNITEHYLYETWAGMMKRCRTPSYSSYQYYGGRGVSVCPEWHKSRVFLEWIDTNLGERPEGYTLDRIDNSGNYEPGNVRWASKKEQIENRRPNVQRPLSVQNITYSPHKKGGWQAHICVNGKSVYLGYHKERVQCILNSHIKFYSIW